MAYRLVMGNQAYSSWSLRGWLLLRAFGIDFEHEVVRLFVPGYQDFLDACHPAASVPALRVTDDEGSFVVWDSLSIAEFLHERHPDAGIWPANTRARAAARSLCAEMHSSYTALRGSMPMNLRREYRSFVADPATQTDIDRIQALWTWAMQHWGGEGPYLFGARFCAADAFYAPLASRFRTYGVPLEAGPKRYADALLANPATREFYAAGLAEAWVKEDYEFDCD